jgi:hypothetical protein
MTIHRQMRLPAIALLVVALSAAQCCELENFQCVATRVPGTNQQVISCTAEDVEGSRNDTIPMPQ